MLYGATGDILAQLICEGKEPLGPTRLLREIGKGSRYWDR